MADNLMRKSDSPFRGEMMSLRDAMDRLMAGSWVSPWRWFGDWSNGFDMGMPDIDLIENANEYTLKAALPGWQPKDVNVTYERGAVTISGDVKEEKEEKDKTYHRKEISQKSFTRTLDLPGDVDVDKANADFRNGLLTLTLPKTELVKPKQIKIAVK